MLTAFLHPMKIVLELVLVFIRDVVALLHGSLACYWM